MVNTCKGPSRFDKTFAEWHFALGGRLQLSLVCNKYFFVFWCWNANQFIFNNEKLVKPFQLFCW